MVVVESPFDLPRSEPYASYEQSHRFAPSNEGWHTLSIGSSSNKPFDLDQTFRVPPRSNELKDILPTLLDCPELTNKRIKFQNLQLKATLSTGASGEVWLAQFNGEQVAVRQLLNTNENSLKELSAFAEEIVLSATFNHPHIVSSIGVAWSRRDRLAMVMEYCPMGDLRRVLEDSGRLLSWSRDKIRMAVGIVQALRYLHERNPPIIHRDLKSKNILLTETLEWALHTGLHLKFWKGRSTRSEQTSTLLGWCCPRRTRAKRRSPMF